jgi:hypothetical protein
MTEATTGKPDYRGDMLKEASDIVSGARDAAYGSPEDNFARIAALWSPIFKTDVTPRQVTLAMIQLKVAREINKHSDDNFVDIAGYAACGYEIEKKIEAHNVQDLMNEFDL